jgi:hypothetical protein
MLFSSQILITLSYNVLDVSAPAKCNNCLNDRANMGIDILVSPCSTFYELLGLGWLLIKLHHVHSTLDEHFHYISKIHITCNRYQKIMIFPNKTPLSNIYFNIIIIQVKSSTYIFFDIFK